MKKNVAVIGCGYWGKNLVRNFSALGALHTICDARDNLLREFSSQYQDVKTCSNYDEVLKDENVRGVAVATPAATHFNVVRQALLMDKDVFVEKPLALTVEQGQGLVDLAKKRDKILMVGHLLEYHPAVIKLKELVSQGELGKLQYIYSNRLNLGKFRTEENILWSFAPHDISVILLLLDGEIPYEITAQGSNYLNPDIADVTLSTMGFKNNVRAHIFVSWLHPFKEQRLVVVGNKKMAEFDDTEKVEKLRLFSHDIEWIDNIPVPRKREPEIVPISDEEPLKLECQDFIDCLENRNPPRVDGEKGIQVLKVLNACQQSLEQEGRMIYLQQENIDYYVHPTSIIEQPVSIGTNTKIWHFSHIMKNVTLGDNCVVGQNVFIADGVRIGNGVKLENNVSVFSGVVLEDDVFCGPSCVFTNVINPRSHIDKKNEFQQTVVKKGASIGANATVICGNTIGCYAFVGAGSVVTSDIPDYALVYGNPARIHGWLCQCGEKIEFDESMKAVCQKCGAAYTKQGDWAVKAIAGGE